MKQIGMEAVYDTPDPYALLGFPPLLSVGVCVVEARGGLDLTNLSRNTGCSC